jgi:hypothetical protein
LKNLSVAEMLFFEDGEGKNYNVVFYNFEMILAVGYRARSHRVKKAAGKINPK